mmetsp:Transcript_3025/g.10905  ORF Transcript_3025/g.10905 Transcript_3025/m.10905 type:complete len:674 (-) Transcript_3025:95-2116(-)
MAVQRGREPGAIASGRKAGSNRASLRKQGSPVGQFARGSWTRKPGSSPVPRPVGRRTSSSTMLTDGSSPQKDSTAAADGPPQPLRLYIGGLSPNVTAIDLEKRLGAFGKVSDVEFARIKDYCAEFYAEGSQHRGFAFVSLEPSSGSALKRCFAALNGCKWRGNRLRVEKASLDFQARRQREWDEIQEQGEKLRTKAEFVPPRANISFGEKLHIMGNRGAKKLFVASLDSQRFKKKKTFPYVPPGPIEHMWKEVDEVTTYERGKTRMGTHLTAEGTKLHQNGHVHETVRAATDLPVLEEDRLTRELARERIQQARVLDKFLMMDANTEKSPEPNASPPRTRTQAAVPLGGNSVEATAVMARQSSKRKVTKEKKTIAQESDVTASTRSHPDGAATGHGTGMPPSTANKPGNSFAWDADSPWASLLAKASGVSTRDADAAEYEFDQEVEEHERVLMEQNEMSPANDVHQPVSTMVEDVYEDEQEEEEPKEKESPPGVGEKEGSCHRNQDDAAQEKGIETLRVLEGPVAGAGLPDVDAPSQAMNDDTYCQTNLWREDLNSLLSTPFTLAITGSAPATEAMAVAPDRTQSRNVNGAPLSEHKPTIAQPVLTRRTRLSASFGQATGTSFVRPSDPDAGEEKEHEWQALRKRLTQDYRKKSRDALRKKTRRDVGRRSRAL